MLKEGFSLELIGKEVIFLLAVLGLCIGSFINAAVYRVATKKPLGLARSVCPRCQKELAWWQLIPVISFLILRGRCHYCKKTISPQYPLIELLTALAFVGLGWQSDILAHPLEFFFRLAIIALLIFVALYDFKHLLILDLAVFLGIILTIPLLVIHSSWFWPLVGAGGLAGLFGLIYFFSRGTWIGFGDVKLALFLGLVVGQLTFLVLLFASWLGVLVALVLLLTKKATLKTRLPFGTLLALATIAVIIWQSPLNSWLTSFI